MSKYSLAKELIAELSGKAEQSSVDPDEAHEALLISLVQQMKDDRGVDYIRSILQYEIDSLGSGGTFEIQRGGGHS